eukprot:4478639-Karenia_brevis.AAC.1
MFIDAKKAHLNPKCGDNVYIQLPAQSGEKPWFNHWLSGCRPAAAAWEDLYFERFEGAGFIAGVSCGV